MQLACRMSPTAFCAQLFIQKVYTKHARRCVAVNPSAMTGAAQGGGAHQSGRAGVGARGCAMAHRFVLVASSDGGKDLHHLKKEKTSDTVHFVHRIGRSGQR
ncbi:hypothetical protein SDC9_112742 [bioreactor metagenome]|uniref:Uncharacterized protein n=1 Tax=bioreactor metagenome TaxID=1076179 RepID=A0A645BL53_9ZZZZ